jgi:hypothetical protein
MATQSSVPVIIEAADVGVVCAGGATGWRATTGTRSALAELGLVQSCPPLPREADVRKVSGSVSLDEVGVRGAVLSVLGCTPKSIAVVLHTGDAFVGGMVIGMYAPWRVDRSWPVSYFIYADHVQNRESPNA